MKALLNIYQKYSMQKTHSVNICKATCWFRAGLAIVSPRNKHIYEIAVSYRLKLCRVILIFGHISVTRYMIQAIQWSRKANGQNIIRECTDAWLVSEELRKVTSHCPYKHLRLLLDLCIKLAGVWSYTAKPTFVI